MKVTYDRGPRRRCALAEVIFGQVGWRNYLWGLGDWNESAHRDDLKPVVKRVRWIRDRGARQVTTGSSETVHNSARLSCERTHGLAVVYVEAEWYKST